ncbi:formate/nitrite transporter family protein [Aurantiacibacter sp. MUD11]|uniref:formate/nitrite transporter family protein n=1 Tax=Aurantiacibacter sp. MUD11 TaxID=3003265 RepID=UPI0022AA5728|nr:formate/nitrite transporter family protein [Aurantiacibacter sp. MUD11]WAT18927.1 formate/nitrite transporter family protein [Aurantiacibacter sp. MUD11]
MTTGPHPLDVVSPARIAELVDDVAIRKVHLGLVPVFALAVLAGAFIALGAAFYIVTVTGSDLGFGPTRLLGGFAFSLGLILVIVGGAELFTGNSLIVLARADQKVTTGQLLRNWAIVYVGNLTGALGTAMLVHLSGALSTEALAATVVGIAETKLALPAGETFFRGILCNVLVCLAVWMCFAAHSVSGKVLVIAFPIAAFVALGFEHSVANMFLLPMGMLESGVFDLSGAVRNLLVVTAGNVVGGGVLVALTYWLIYLSPHGAAKV